MKRNIILYLILLISGVKAFGQPGKLKVNYRVNPNGDVTFQAINLDYCDYFVTLNFTQLTNTNIPASVQVNASPGSSQVLKLTPLRTNEPIRFSYSYSFIKGNAHPKINRQFLYLMPVKGGNSTEAGLIKDFKEFHGRPLSESWYIVFFSMNEGDTVYAARGGIVNAAGPGTSPHGDRTTNSVEIFHSDGTFGKYDLLKGGRMLPKPGTKIFAGDPVGIVDKIYDTAYVVFMVYYLDSGLITINGNFATAGYSSFKPRFALTEKTGGYIDVPATYSVIKPVNVITREMKKKEAENFRSTHKK